MAKFTHHLFVCGNQRPKGHPRGCCDTTGEDALRDRLKSEIRSRGLRATVRVNKAGCLDQCELGPVVVIYPQAIWYGGVGLDDVERIIDTSIQGDGVVEDLLISDEMLNTKGRGPMSSGSCDPCALPSPSERVAKATESNTPKGESER